jgi:hypothetical protein
MKVFKRRFLALGMLSLFLALLAVLSFFLSTRSLRGSLSEIKGKRADSYVWLSPDTILTFDGSREKGWTLKSYNLITGREVLLKQLSRLFNETDGSPFEVKTGKNGNRLLWRGADGELIDASADGLDFRRCEQEAVNNYFWIGSSSVWVEPASKEPGIKLEKVIVHRSDVPNHITIVPVDKKFPRHIFPSCVTDEGNFIADNFLGVLYFNQTGNTGLVTNGMGIKDLEIFRWPVHDSSHVQKFTISRPQNAKIEDVA